MQGFTLHWCRVNQGHPSTVDTIVTNAALFPALPGKILWDWVGLARWGDTEQGQTGLRRGCLRGHREMEAAEKAQLCGYKSLY